MPPFRGENGEINETTVSRSNGVDDCSAVAGKTRANSQEGVFPPSREKEPLPFAAYRLMFLQHMLTTTRKKTALIASGWAACTALAFWAGTHWRGENSDATERAKRAALLQSGLNTGEAKGSGRIGQTPDGSPAKDAAVIGAKAIRELTPEQTAARTKEIFAMEDMQQRTEAFLEMLKGLHGNEQISAAMEAMTENGYNNRERGREFSMLMTRWAKEDPETALAWTQKHGDWRNRWGAQTALAVWSQNDPDKAVAWALAHPNKDKEEGNHNMVGVINGLTKTNLDLAAQLAQNMDRSNARGEAMERVLEQFFKQRGPDAAKEMVMGLPDGPYKNGALGRLADRLADSDAKSAAVWAAALPDGEAKPGVVAQVVDEWAGKNPNDAGNWLNALPQTAAMDESRERFAFRVQEKDPEAAIAWAGTITDENRRNKTSFRLVREWMSREPDSAKAWVRNSQLPADMKERLINRRRG